MPTTDPLRNDAPPPLLVAPGLKPAALPVQLASLLLIELTNWRWSWRSMLITASLAPLLGILGLGVFARDSGAQALAYVLTGNLVVSLMFGSMGRIQSHVVFMRFQGALDYFATLPVQRPVLILAMVLAFQLLSLPSLLVTLLVGNLLLQVPLHPHPLALLAIPLAGLPLAGLGAVVGASARTPEEANSTNLVLTLLLTALGPVVVPPEYIPAGLLLFSRLSPATYAASALRQTLLGPVTGQLAIDLAALVAFSLLAFWFAGKKMDWRIES